MEQRLSNTWRLSLSERNFINAALADDLRIDGRRPFDYRRLTVKFGREDGSSEVQLGDTHVIGYVSGQLVQPYKDRPHEGMLAIFTELSPMADPSFEAGRPGEFAIELGRIVDRGLRDSKAVDMESLCVVAGKSVWSLRLDLHVLDNGGNLIDAANVAALAALMTYRRLECTIGGENGQDVIVHDPEVREPISLIIHHLPVAITFAIFGEGNIMVIDPSYKEEAVMGGRFTVTINSNGDVCAIQKPGGEGLSASVVMQCLRIAAIKARDITSKIQEAVDSYNKERLLRKVKRHPSAVKREVNVPDVVMKESQIEKHQEHVVKNESLKITGQANMEVENSTLQQGGHNRDKHSNMFTGGPSSWDPYPTGTTSNLHRSSQDLPGSSKVGDEKTEAESGLGSSELVPQTDAADSLIGSSTINQQNSAPKNLKDAVKLKSSKKTKLSSNNGAN